MLVIDKLSFTYPGATVPALQQVSFEAVRGEVLGLLGANGAGKTTLIAHVAGLLPVQHGAITVDQVALATAHADAPTRVAVAPQEYAFYPSLSVTENLACFAGVGQLSGKAKQERIAECLGFAQLESYAAVRADRLSGGLKRRLNLAIALLHRPELLLFDEPTVGVDPQSRAFLLQAIRKLAQDGCAVIYTSHYMEEVEAIADRVVILDHGRVLKYGSMSELLGNGGAQLQLAVEGGNDELLHAVLAPFGQVARHAGGVQLALTSRSSFAGAVAAVEAAGLTVTRARLGDVDLEQLFMDLTDPRIRN